MLCQLVITSAFFNVFFRTLILNINCDFFLTNLDNSTDDYNGNIENYDNASYPTDFCEMLIVGIKIVNSDVFFSVTNIRTNVQNDSSDF